MSSAPVADPPLAIDVNTLSKGDLRLIALREFRRRALIAQARRGSKASQETRERISAAAARAWAKRKAGVDAGDAPAANDDHHIAGSE